MVNEPVVVNITVGPDGKDCFPDPDPFPVKDGSTVMFKFDEYPNADIVFTKGSPFAKADLKPETLYTVINVRLPKFPYEVRWGGEGSGNGTGEV